MLKKRENYNEEPTKKYLSSLFILIGIVFFFYVLDWSFLKGGITVYPVFCPPDYNENNGCYPLTTSTYYPNEIKQEVIERGDFGIETFTKCTVIDRKNWECKWDDESGTFGFNKGSFNSITLKASSQEMMTLMHEAYIQTRYVPRYIYFLEEWNIL